MNFKLGFSLIELMVVVAIVAVLSAVAVPVYKAYVIKTEMSRLYSILDNLRYQMVIGYQKNGVFPTTYEYNGNTYTQGWHEVNDANFHWLNVAVGENGRSDLIYAAATPTEEMWQKMTGSPVLGQHFAIFSWDENGVIKTLCTDSHQWNSIPQAYLPPGCVVQSGYPVGP